MFRNVSIQTKLPAGYGFALIIIVLLGAFATLPTGHAEQVHGGDDRILAARNRVAD